jgi:hypothetical protein
MPTPHPGTCEPKLERNLPKLVEVVGNDVEDSISELFSNRGGRTDAHDDSSNRFRQRRIRLPRHHHRFSGRRHQQPDLKVSDRRSDRSRAA